MKRRNQLGMTLISLLIGLLLSMLCILAGLTLYKNLVQVSTTSKQYTGYDGKLAAIMLSIQKAVQVAGYGIPDAGPEHIKKDTPSATERRLLWRFLEAGTPVCKGVRELPFNDTTTTPNKLYRRAESIQVPGPACTLAADLSSLNWTAEALIGEFRIISGELLETYLAANDFILDYQILPGQCSPFGATSPQNHYYLQVTAPNAAELNGAVAAGTNTFNYCLSNFYPTPAP